MPTTTSTSNNIKPPPSQRIKLNLNQQNQQTYRGLNTWKLKQQAQKIEKMQNNRKNINNNNNEVNDNLNNDYDDEQLIAHNYHPSHMMIPHQAYYDRGSILAFSKLQTLNKKSTFRNADPKQSYLNEFLLNDNGKPLSLSHGKRSFSFNSKLSEVPYNKNLNNFNKLMRNDDEIQGPVETLSTGNKTQAKQPFQAKANIRVDTIKAANSNNKTNNIDNGVINKNNNKKNETPAKNEKIIDLNTKQQNVKQQQQPQSKTQLKTNQKESTVEANQQTSSNKNQAKLNPIHNKPADKPKTLSTTPTNKVNSREQVKREPISESQTLPKKPQHLPAVKPSKVPKTNVPVNELIKLKQNNNKLRSKSSEEISDLKASQLARSLTPIERKLDEVLNRLDDFDKFRNEFASSQLSLAQQQKKSVDKKEKKKFPQQKEFLPKVSTNGYHDDSIYSKKDINKTKANEKVSNADFDFLSDVDDMSINEGNLRNNLDMDPEMKFKRITPNHQFTFDKYTNYNSNNNPGESILKNYGVYSISNNFSEENRSESILSKMYYDQHSNQKIDQGKYSNSNSTIKRNKTYNGGAVRTSQNK